jgi:alkylation response protein AidB-like acyl-CoA dehydrogenase
MDFELSPADLAWQGEVRRFLAEHYTEDVLAERVEKRPMGRGPATERFWRKVAERGWYTLNWPEEYGGQALDPLRQLIMVEEFEYVHAPVMDMTITSLAPVIIDFGTEENKEDWLPGIRTGEVRFALGYSEPDSGTDLASLRTKAQLDGDEWVINGEKIWNTGAHYQTHEWLAVRTGEGPGHRGISILIVPIDAPGVTVSPIWTWGDHRTNSTHFDEVRVPRRNLIGEAGKGWTYITAALDNERGALGAIGGVRRLVDDLIADAKATVVDGRRLSEDPVVRSRLSELHAEVEVARMLSYTAACTGTNGNFATIPATMLKVMVTELRVKAANAGVTMFGLRGQLAGIGSGAPAGGWAEHEYREGPLWRFGGGTNEVMRDVIAQRGYGLPRAGRR